MADTGVRSRAPAIPLVPRTRRLELKRATFLVLLGASLAVGGGCATYKPIDVSTQAADTSWRDESGASLEGARVRVTTQAGDRYEGKVVRANDQEVVIDESLNYGGARVVLAPGEVATFELEQQKDGLIEAAWFVGMGVALAAAFLSTSWGLH